MGVTLTDEYTEQVLDRPYYGVYYGYAALPMQPDELRYLTSETLEDCTVYNYETGKPGAVYDMEKGAGNDPYELFLSGSISLLSIENPNAETDRELIVFRDSFGSSLAPLLAEGYAKITLADIRYFLLPDGQAAGLHRHGRTVPLQRAGAQQQRYAEIRTQKSAAAAALFSLSFVLSR